MMSGKRKRVVLTVKEKVEIVERLNQGVSGILLAQHYGVGTSTISDIKKNRASIIEIGSLLDSRDRRKTLKSAENKELESEMIAWFLQKRSQGEPVSGPSICERALEVNALLGGDPEFKASTGWLTRFKSRHGICREADIHGERLSSDQSVAESVQNIMEGCYKSAEMVYNAETGFNWKGLASRSLASKYEVIGYKKPSTSRSSTYVPSVVPCNILLNNVETSTASPTISQEPIPVSLVNSQVSIVKQLASPGLPQITEISWGTAVPSLPTVDDSWAADSILPTPTEPRTRDIGVQVEVISTRTKNVIFSREWQDSSQPSQNQRQIVRTSSANNQYDLFSVLRTSSGPPHLPPPLAPLRTQCTSSSKEPEKQQNASANSGKSERVFLVFEAMLLQLFTFCRLCFAGCSASVNSSCISVVMVQTQCDNGHKLKWESRPTEKSVGFIQLLQKEVNRLRKERSECLSSQQRQSNVKKRLKIEPELIDVVELLSLPKPLTCSSRTRDNRCVDS